MAVSLKFYTVTDENNKLNKNLGTATSLTGTFKEPFDFINPEITVYGSTSNMTTTKYFKLNYMYSSTLGRYYFITDMQIEQQGILRIRCHIDVLMTYNTAIKNMKGIMDRQENYYNLYLNDPELKKLSYPLIQVKAFPNMIQSSDYNFFVITAGG